MTFQANQFPRLRNLSNPLPNSCSIRRKGKLVRNESGNTPNELSQGAKKAARKLLLLLLLLLVARARRIYIYIYLHTHIQHTHPRTGVYPRSRCKPSQRVIPRGNKDHSTCPPLSPPLPARTFTTVDRPPRLPPSTLAIEQKKKGKKEKKKNHASRPCLKAVELDL